jgi:hypothetical protein
VLLAGLAELEAGDQLFLLASTRLTALLEQLLQLSDLALGVVGQDDGGEDVARSRPLSCLSVEEGLVVLVNIWCIV